MLNIVQANAEKSNPCIDNTDKTCQHYNNGNDKLVGSPHYPCCGGEATGDPHGQSQFNPEKAIHTVVLQKVAQNFKHIQFFL